MTDAAARRSFSAVDMELSALERMTRLLEVAGALSRTMTPDEVADVVVHMGLSAVGARRGAVLTIDDESREYHVVERTCETAAATGACISRLPLDHPAPLAACARTGRPISTAEGLCLPLLVRGHPIGALALELLPDQLLDDERCALLAAIAEQCAQALERARLYELERVRREELERSNRRKDDFLGIVSHELRTPLSAILGWARMLRAGLVSEDARQRALEAIERNAALQARLVDDLLDVSRIVSGKLELDVEPVSLSAVIEAALDSVRPAVDGKGLELRLTLARAGVTVLGDARRLQQVVWNLLTNSIKFTGRGGSIDVSLARDARVVRLRVRDDGAGIPADVLPHVFERFKQADGSATREHGGLGLGLSIVRHVVEAHGGCVAAASDGEGRGAELSVELPACDDADAPSRPGAEARALLTPLDGARVLLVDDDDDTRDFLTTALRAAGAQVQGAGSAKVALEAVRAWRPDAIVSDIAMPDEDGYTLIRRVRALPGDGGGATPAVALTALARPRDRVRALAAGFQTHLTKPVDPGELALTVASLLRARP